MESSDQDVRVGVFDVRAHLLEGQVIPAHPLALTASRYVDERSQRALTHYYVASGAGGIAVGVHTTGFAIHKGGVGLYEPVLALAAECANNALLRQPRNFIKVAGLIGSTAQAVHEGVIAGRLGYDCGLLSLGAWHSAGDEAILAHCREVASVIPLFGFYLQPAVGGRTLSYRFWRDFVEIPNVVAIKVAPFNRYATLDVVRALLDSGRRDVALYTGNDDSIVADLLTDVISGVGAGTAAVRFASVGSAAASTAGASTAGASTAGASTAGASTAGVQSAEVRTALVRTATDTTYCCHFVGGLLGQWAVWTSVAAKLLTDIHAWRRSEDAIPREWLTSGAALTMANAAVFDAANGFAGCIPGILHVLRGQGLVESELTLGDDEVMSPGQAELILEMRRRHPGLTDDEFVAEHVDEWRRG